MPARPPRPEEPWLRLTKRAVREDYLALAMAERNGANRSLRKEYLRAAIFSGDPLVLRWCISAMRDAEACLEEAKEGAGSDLSSGEQILERIAYHRFGPRGHRRRRQL